ncbi:transglycosylase domain-containing protein [Pseudochryseolinea flava]|uniref:Penicillin-binding protein n=1 Tax=Pseudochryseolinea flava TaxID=2059302 RepID=A0A364Y6F9_9BACT|nr:transglycosylase domain-containing protein [Pseudochryseolinea flava]RAW01397.1 penicillin-binding protein [Pseudochryseolinea flava]
MMKRFLEQAREYVNKAWQYFKGQSISRRILIGGCLFFGVLFLSTFLFVGLVWVGAFGSLPSKAELRLVENPLATEVYSADSVLLGKYFIQERSNIRYEDVPQHLVQALIATEDVRFFQHGGVDTKSLARVLVKSILLQRESSGGGSTITQQLAKNLYPRRDYWLLSLPINKIREIIIARRLERVYDKESLLSLYLNTIPFGDNTFGIETASQRFFSVPTKRLTLDQAAVLVGMLKATYTYNPRLFPERSKMRRDVVLAQLQKYEMISEGRRDSLQALPIKLNYRRTTHHEGLAPYFRDYIREDLMTWCKANTNAEGKPYNLYTDGLKIYTTIDSRLQRYAEEAVRQQMTVIQKSFQSHWGKRDPWHARHDVLEDAIHRTARYRDLKSQGLQEAEITRLMSKKYLMSVFTWEGEKEMMMSPIDSIKHYLTFLNAGVLAIEPSAGEIKAWVGGINHNYFQFDHVRTTTRRQVGSTFKPIVYAAALEQGADPCDYISAEKTVYTNAEGWTPTNTGEDNYDLKYSLAGGLAYSVNTVSVKVLERAGIQNTVNLAHKMGISATMPTVPSLALGVADVSMTEIVTAYSCFANNGKVITPFYITSINSRHGETLESFQPEKPKQALSPETANLMLHMMKRVIDEGTGARLRSQYGIEGDVAGKTGTTQDNADGWFIAILPNLVVGSWVGADDPRIHFRSTALGQGANTALPIVGRMLRKAQHDSQGEYKAQYFPALNASLRSRLSCDLYKSDSNFFQRLFGKRDRDEEKRKAFGEADKKKKKGFLRKIF